MKIIQTLKLCCVAIKTKSFIIFLSKPKANKVEILCQFFEFHPCVQHQALLLGALKRQRWAVLWARIWRAFRSLQKSSVDEIRSYRPVCFFPVFPNTLKGILTLTSKAAAEVVQPLPSVFCVKSTFVIIIQIEFVCDRF